MIEGTNRNISESAYRKIELDSSSSLKDFSFDRKKYYRKYILNEEIIEKDSQALTMGKLVETLLMESELFDKKFYMSACASEPTGLMLSFVEALYKHTMDSTVDGIVGKDFKELSKLAYNDSGFKISYEQVMKKFEGSDAEIFYREILAVRANNMIVVTPDNVNNAEKIVQELRENSVTAEVVNLVSSARYTVINQMQIENFDIDDLPIKAMLDKVVIDHVKGIIQGYDLKCVWAVENFYEEYYLYRRAYIQAYVYLCALKHLAEELSKEEGIVYTARPLRFIVCDSANYLNPLIYTLDETDMKDAYEGFEYKGRKYPGVHSIIADLQWAMENNIWNISRENFLTNGVVKLR